MPERRLWRDVLYMATKQDSVVLDFFAGSGTTGQAILELNSEDNTNRQFILIEMRGSVVEEGEGAYDAHCHVF